MIECSSYLAGLGVVLIVIVCLALLFASVYTINVIFENKRKVKNLDYRIDTGRELRLELQDNIYNKLTIIDERLSKLEAKKGDK